MDQDQNTLDEVRRLYKEAVDAWVASIQTEQELALKAQSIAEIDDWAAAHAQQEEFRAAAKQAKEDFESALRQEFFGF
jgi:conjugal transfer/entry exclusion protein